MRLRSIRWRLVASYMLLTLLTAGLVGALALSLVKRHAEQQEVDYLTANANAAARQALPFLWPRPQQRDLQRLAQTSAFLGNVRVRILARDQRVLADSGARSGPDTFVWILPPDQAGAVQDDDDAPFIMSLMLGRRRAAQGMDPSVAQLPPGTRYTVVQRDDGPWGRRFVFQAVPEGKTTGAANNTVDNTPRSDRSVSVPVGDANTTAGYVELSGAPAFGAQTLAATTQAVLVAAIGASLVAGVVALFVGRGLTAPLNSLALAANRMSGGDLSARAPVTSDDEAGQLARQFNQMAARLQTSFADLAAERDTLRRFIADASHELRTPITALKTFNELLRAGTGDSATHAEFLAESQAQIERLEWITRNLLDLSRLDSGVADLELASHDAADILQSACAAFKPLAQSKGVTLSVSLPEPGLSLRCDRGRVEIALSNLIDNALKFTPAGGHVTVGADRLNSNTRLWVEDDGAGIDPADLPRLFERFYRGRNSGPRGSGLGLALVKSVVQAHGGQVSVESVPGQGSRFVIELPG